MSAKLSHISNLLRNNKSARELLERRQREVELLAQVRDRLPESMRSHCLDVGIAGHRLTVFLDSPAWLTRARFLTDEIAASLKEQQITEARIQVRLDCDDATSSRQRALSPLGLTADTVQHLLEAADNMQDPELSRVLKKFATRHALMHKMKEG